MRRVFCAIAILASALCASGQTIKIPESWDKLAAKADEVTNLTLDKSSLRLGAKFIRDGSDDKSVAVVERLLSKLQGIYVHSLEFKNEGEFTDADVEPIRAQLHGPEWSRELDVNDKIARETVEIYIRQLNGQNAGIVVLSEEPKELTFIHLDGPIDFDDLASLSGDFGIPPGLDAVAHAHGATAKPKQSTAARR